jgi:hypothetical protein
MTIGNNGTTIGKANISFAFAAAALIAGCSGAGAGEFGEGDDEAGSLGQITNPLGTPGRLGAIKDEPATVSARRLASAPPAGALPAAVNLAAKLPPPGDQGSQGSCVGWASGYALKTYQEGVEDKWSVSNDRYQYSPSWIYNQINGGADNGSVPSHALDLMVNKGADTLEFFSYSDQVFTAQPSSASLTRAARFKANSWGTLDVSSTTFKQTLANGQPIMIALQVYPDFDSISSSNEVYNSAAGVNRGRHAITIIGYDDAKSAFRFINSWGTGWGLGGYGWIGYSFIGNSSIALDAYTLTDAPNAAPPVNNSLYIVQDGHVWRADNDFGDFSLLSSADWTGASSSTAMGGSVYIIQNSHLHKVNPATGAYTVLGGAAWPGQTTMTSFNGVLYITQDDGLWKIDNLATGHFVRVGNADWTGATSMAALGSSLYIVQADRLHKVNPSTGSFTVLGTPDWPGATSMTAIGSSLVIAQDDGLWKVDNLSTGAYHRLGNADWSGTTSMTNLNGNLYVIQAGHLHQTDPNTGAYDVLGRLAWTGPTVMAAVP